MYRVRTIATGVAASVGLITILLVGIGAIADVLAMDPTSGGYEEPYTDFSGEPISWDEAYVTPDGMYAPGYVIDTHIDCTSGMISLDVFGVRMDYREFSDRALAVHEPREACEERGFSPDF